GRRLWRVCRDLRQLGGDRGHIFHRRLPRNAPLRLSPELRHRRDRGWRHARRHAAAVNGARGLRHHHRAGHRQTVHRRHYSRPACDRHVHDHDRHHRLGQAGFPARREAHTVERTPCRAERHLGAPFVVHLRDRRALRIAVPAAFHADRGRRRWRQRRGPHRRAAVWLLSYHHADATEGDGVPHRAWTGEIRRTCAHHGHVSAARLPDGCDGDDHSHHPHHLPRDHAPWL